MAVTAHVFTKAADNLSQGRINFATHPFRAILLTAATTGLGAAQDTASSMADVKAVTGFTELATGVGGSNYVQNANSTSSGVLLAGGTWSEAGHVYTYTATSPSWTTAGAAFNPAFLVLFDANGGADATNYAVGWQDFGGAQLGTGGTWTFTISASGLFTATGS